MRGWISCAQGGRQRYVWLNVRLLYGSDHVTPQNITRFICESPSPHTHTHTMIKNPKKQPQVKIWERFGE